ncbi:glycosyl hydrolase family 1 [Jatrophihabitans endophyticus]|uniref:Glycosyl hydrolase family 1 n=1 Tax=Jatrophihabitans endophyticus TaxID=1206085 RepID=A0A1M5DG98_9ACTN|nr:family 1 glycosylhydrolase [Jatrophihabitans endophyticus]SHF65980.1 glycosyl hydrolase family 1 [Jatrophihabitans endophyticus]
MTSSTPTAFADGRLHFAVGIEDTFVPHTRPGHRALDEYELTGHYDRWRQDIDLAAASGATAIRYGVPWYRVEPAPGRFEWTWLDRVVEHLLEVGLTPIVDLMHYGTPLWLDNQSINAAYPQRVADYAAAVAGRYADLLHVYTPLNEPNINAEWCGETGAWPPYLTGADGWLKVAVAVAHGIVLTQQAVRAELGDRATFVHVEAGLRYDLDDGAGDTAADSVRRREQRDLLIEDLVCGLVDDAHPLLGFVLAHGVTADRLQWHREHVARPDVMGVNYYPHLSTGAVGGTGSPDVDAAPPPRGRSGVDGLDAVLRRFHQRYDAPVMLTETSARATDDQLGWLDDSVAHVLAMREGGFPVVGYTWFPLFDLVDWSYRTGTEPVAHYLEPLGAIRLVPGSAGSPARELTPTFERFRALATAHGAGRPGDVAVAR